jgi:V/A-type H+/Na+-transporting ATPase subunit A
LRQDFLQQNGFDPVDASASMPKNYGLMQMFLKFNKRAGEALRGGATIDEIIQSPVIEKLSRARYIAETEFAVYRDAVLKELDTAFAVHA